MIASDLRPCLLGQRSSSGSYSRLVEMLHGAGVATSLTDPSSETPIENVEINLDT
jgi:hypothetical protein